MKKNLSLSDDWETPDDLFDLCKDTFGIEADACAYKHNTKMPHFISPKDDALGPLSWKEIIKKKYKVEASVFWCNPPYQRVVPIWVDRMLTEAKAGISVISLLPAYPGTGWVKVLEYSGLPVQFSFLRGRLKFKPGKTSARFYNVVVAINPKWQSIEPPLVAKLAERCSFIHYNKFLQQQKDCMWSKK